MKQSLHASRFTFHGCGQTQSGRSMIEMLGVLALAGVMTVGAVMLYQNVRARQVRMTAEMTLGDLASNAKLLFRGRGDYSEISVEYLVKAGALKSDQSPIKGADFSVRGEALGKSFAIVLGNLNFGDCAYFATAKLDWVDVIRVNGFTDNAKSYCYEIESNTVEFIAH